MVNEISLYYDARSEKKPLNCTKDHYAAGNNILIFTTYCLFFKLTTFRAYQKKIVVSLICAIVQAYTTGDGRIYLYVALVILGYVIPVVYAKFISRKGAVYYTTKYI